MEYNLFVSLHCNQKNKQQIKAKQNGSNKQNVLRGYNREN